MSCLRVEILLLAFFLGLCECFYPELGILIERFQSFAMLGTERAQLSPCSPPQSSEPSAGRDTIRHRK